MAQLELISFTPNRPLLIDGHVIWHKIEKGKTIEGLPQIFWGNGMPWREANLWLMEQASSKELKLKTAQTKATAIHAYAKWLEETKTEWWDFPPRKSNRCLYRYRGDLINARDSGYLAPSTVSGRMRVVVSFYRWLKNYGLLSPTWPMWQERTFGIRITDGFGFERTLEIQATDLTIPNRSAPGERLEDGLLPVSATDRDKILGIAKEHASEELFLMMSIGFFTGMRIQTITNLKVSSLTNSVPDPAAPGLYKISVGPGAHPPVATKYGVTGQIWITENLLTELIRYSHSARRLKREAKASKEDKDLVFLTRFGNPYAQRHTDKSTSVNVAMHELKKIAVSHGVIAMREFRFHQTRCTFATELARLAIQAGGALHALAIVKEALLHKDESTSLKYIKFIEKTPIKVEAANTFTKAFLGISSQHEGRPHE